MTLEQLIAFNIALLVAIASPGPAFLLATHTAARRGRTAGMAVGVGLGLMAATWTMMALLGLAVVFQLFPSVYIGAKVLGEPICCTLRTRCGEMRPTPSTGESRRPGTRSDRAFSLTSSIRNPYSSRRRFS